MSLTPSQRRYLRGLAHPLKPVLLLGGKGVTPAVLAELEHALDDHELIKVKLAGGDREERASSLMQLLDASGAENVQTIGHVAVLYRRNDEQPRIALPSELGNKPRAVKPDQPKYCRHSGAARSAEPGIQLRSQLNEELDSGSRRRRVRNDEL